MSEKTYPAIFYAFKTHKQAKWSFDFIEYDKPISIYLKDDFDRRREIFDEMQSKSDELIKQKHSSLFDYCVVNYRPAKPEKWTDNEFEFWLFTSGWTINEETNDWLAPDELPQRPIVDFVPALFTVETKDVEYGWWIWNVAFVQCQYIEGEIHPLPTEIIPKTIKCRIACSYVFNVIEDLRKFIEKMKDS